MQKLKETDPNYIQREVHLYFGCRKRDSDYIYKEDIMKFKEEGFITHLHEAFSREQVGT
jgi:sulfite reductase alpha subunit-like flavoprotein